MGDIEYEGNRGEIFFKANNGDLGIKMEFRKKPIDCSVCRRIDNVYLTSGCTWLCHRCRSFLNLIRKGKESVSV